MPANPDFPVSCYPLAKQKQCQISSKPVPFFIIFWRQKRTYFDDESTDFNTNTPGAHEDWCVSDGKQQRPRSPAPKTFGIWPRRTCAVGRCVGVQVGRQLRKHSVPWEIIPQLRSSCVSRAPDSRHALRLCLPSALRNQKTLAASAGRPSDLFLGRRLFHRGRRHLGRGRNFGSGGHFLWPGPQGSLMHCVAQDIAGQRLRGCRFIAADAPGVGTQQTAGDVLRRKEYTLLGVW